jgi:rubrerythrin
MTTSIWIKAEEMELEAFGYYTNLAKETEVREVAGAFTMIAKEEKKHAEMFKQMGIQGSVNTIPDSTWDPKEVFEKLSKNSAASSKLVTAVDAYNKIIEREYDSVSYYEGLKKESNDEQDNMALEFIIKEEKKHAKVFESILEFINSPKTWVENAEFNIIEDF